MIRFDKIRHMNSKRFILIGIFIGFILKPGYSNDELIKIQHQIKQTEQQNKKIEQQLQTSAKDVEQTKKQLVKAADKVSDLEEQRSALARRIAELDKQRDKISAELSRSYDGVVDSTASI
ncbi:MAG: hypothetical protein IJQ55_00545, partial [Alphaproteobacteria bacterium]|nr:hypothetical protein [Alphaproteobacteria bacterium]